MKAIRLVVLFLLLVTLTIIPSGCSSDNKESSSTEPDKNNSSEIQNSENETEEEAVVEKDSIEESKTEVTSTEEVNTNTDATEANGPVEWVRFTKEDKNFELMYPSNWIIVDKDSYGILLRPKNETQTSFYVDTETTIFADYSYDYFVAEMIGDVMRIRDDCEFSEPESM